MVNINFKIISIVTILFFAAASNQSLHAQDAVPYISEKTFFNDRYAHTGVMLNNDRQSEKKNVGLAALYSLLIPGAGEWYAGNFSTGKYLLGSEITLWMSLYGFYSYGAWLKNDAQSFAEVNAGIDWTGKDDKFFVNVGNFNSRSEYNEKKMRDRDIGALYTESSYDWHWESDDLRREFRDLRVRSDRMLNAIKFAGTAIVANHIISAIIAGNSARLHNERLNNPAEQSNWSIGILPLHNGFVAGIQHTF